LIGSVLDSGNDADTEIEQACHSLTQERLTEGEVLLAKLRAIVPPKMEIPPVIIDVNEPRILASSVIEVERKKIIIDNHLQYLWNKIHKLKGADKSKIGKKPQFFDLITYVGDENINHSRLLKKFNIFNALKENLENKSLYPPEKLSIFHNNLKQHREALVTQRNAGSIRSFSDFFARSLKKYEYFSKSEEVVLALETRI